MTIYTKDFKLKAIKKYNEGVDPEEIIKKTENLKKHNKYYSRNLLRKLTKEYNKKGEKAFIGTGNNTNKILSKNWEKHLDKLSLEKQNEYLKTKIFYLEAERNFLAEFPTKK